MTPPAPPPLSHHHHLSLSVCVAVSTAALQHQRKGYGKFLISFSYELSKKEKLLADQTAENGLKRSIGRYLYPPIPIAQTLPFSHTHASLPLYLSVCVSVYGCVCVSKGGPERPFSDLGRASYMAWWTPRLLTELQRRVKLARVAREAREAKLQRQHTGGGGSVRDDVPTISIKALSEAVSISQEDVFDCLCRLGVLREYDVRVCGHRQRERGRDSCTRVCVGACVCVDVG